VNEPTDELALPHAIALTWGVAARPQRGPKRELSIERIVETAISIADADGLAAVSMSRVATALGFTTMSLYRYVTSKDDLLLLMQDGVLDATPPEPADDSGWRIQLRQWVLFTIALYRKHPWYGEIPVSGVPMTPNNLRIVDSGLRCLRDTRLTDQEKMATILLASSWAKGVGGIEHDLAVSTARTGDPGRAQGAPYLAALRELVTEELFPHLYPVLASGAYTDEEYDDFAFGLERLLDGIGVYIDGNGEHRPDEYRATLEESELYVKDKKVREAAKARREAEKALREARKREREALVSARERAERAVR
jgi:AcrR family transcriptional regulator